MIQKDLILLTGASGYIGTRVAHFLAPRAQVVGTYFTYPSVKVMGVDYCYLDVTNKENCIDVIESVRPVTVIHIAGTKDIQYCEEHPEEAYELHVRGTENLVSACSRLRPRVLYISSDSVFDGQKPIYTEHDEPSPMNVYGRTKLHGEEVVRRSGLCFAVIRLSLIFGWVLRAQVPNFVSYVISELRNGKVLRLPANLFNTPLHVGHAAEGIASIAHSEIEGIINVAGIDRVSRYEFAIRIADSFELERRLVLPTNQTKRLRPMNSCLTTTRLEEELRIGGWSVTEGMEQMRREPLVLSGMAVGSVGGKNRGTYRGL